MFEYDASFDTLSRKLGPSVCRCRAQAWSYITFSWHQTYVTMKRITALPTTFKYVVLEKER